jgi:hypothetical protein
MLTESERDCLERYCALLARRLPDLVVVRMLGSAARVDAPESERTREFPAQVESDGVDAWSSR